MSTRSNRNDYTLRIHRVMDHIEAHLDEDLTLEVLAGIANFSPFHFHRIFRAMVGETLNQFVQRVRLERAAGRLLAEPDTPVTHVALDTGFSSPSVFARSFKNHFGVSASQWREERGGCSAESKIGQAIRKTREADARVRLYVDPSTQRPKWEVTMSHTSGNIELVERPPTRIAYLRHVGPYQGDTELFAGLFSRLFKWAAPAGLVGDPSSEVMCVYHDNPDITDPSNQRVSVGLTAREDTTPSGDVNLMTVQGGQYAMGRFRIAGDEYAEAWDAIFGGWLPESGFVPNDGPCFEVYEDPAPDEDGRMSVCIYVPVKPMDS